LIDIKNLTAGYDNKIILNNVSCKIENNKTTTIIGPNGSGKSTLIKCIAKQLKPFSGEVFLDGTNILTIKPKEFAKKIAYLKQSRDASSVTVQTLVSHGRFPHMGFPRKMTVKDKQIVRDAMQKTGIEKFKDKELCELSGGECQKVYLAMTLAQEANTIILDEPTTYLDIKHQLEVLKIISQLKQEGKTVISVLHDINSALQISDNVIILNKGEVTFCDSPQALINTNIIDDAFDIKTQIIEIPNNNILLRFNL
jgi:ABC-type cobalamin/Fe3+-siderophores transport system ATPase subunit